MGVQGSGQILGGTDETVIGNVGDREKVDALIEGLTTKNACNVFVNAGEYTITQRAEIDVPGTTYTVGAGNKFSLVGFYAAFDAQPSTYVRLKKQTGGSGAFVTQFKTTLEIQGQGQSYSQFIFPQGLLLGNAGDVFKLTVETTIVKGVLWACYLGIEAT